MSSRHGLTRVERAAARRRERALAHLRRIGDRARQPASRGPTRRARALLLFGSIAAGALLGGPLLRIAAHARPVDVIHVRGAVQVPADAVVEAVGVGEGSALASLDPELLAARVAALPWIAGARAVRLPLGPVVVGVEERVAVALARSPASTAFVDATGTAFAPADADADAALPRLVLAEDFALGTPDARLIAGLELAYRLPELGLMLPAEVGLAAADDPEGFSLRLPGLDARIVLGREALEERLADLARLLAAGLPELGAAAGLDLRIADRAVLRSQPPRDGAAPAAPERGSAPAPGTRPPGDGGPRGG
jgi:cell division septal protein FtsQ